MAAIPARGPYHIPAESAAAGLRHTAIEALDPLKLAGVIRVIAVRNYIARNENSVPGGFRVQGDDPRKVELAGSTCGALSGPGPGPLDLSRMLKANNGRLWNQSCMRRHVTAPVG
jgi:hypothetical protein